MQTKIIILSLSLLFMGCNNYTISNMNSIKGNGNIIEKTISISDITSIENTGIFNIYVKQGEKEELKIETDENIMEYFKYNIDGKSILVSFESGSFSPTKANVYITLKNINTVKNSGSGNINIDNYNFSSLFTSENRGSGSFIMTNISSSDELLIKNSGSGNIYIKGKTKILNLFNSGSGNTNTFELIAEIVNTKNSGSGNVKVYCEKELTIKNSGSGCLKYKGNAIIKDVSSSGSGNVSKEND